MSDPVGALRIGRTRLLAGRADGPMHGCTAVVKDLLDVAGVATGAGNPDWLADATPATTTASAVRRLVDAGFDIVGKSHTDELAFSLSGTNAHYGTPRNPAAPGRVPGGSSSGSASAVAAGLADLGVGTDTGGSIRVPASYCGLYGWRPTHGRVPIDGCVPLAPTFDTVGLLARDASVLHDGALALLATTAASATAPRRLLVAADLVALADAEVASMVKATTAELAMVLGATLDDAPFADGEQDRWLAAFRARQLYEAWQSHGAWITRRRPAFGPGIAARFAAAARADAVAARAADPVRDEVRERLRSALDADAMLVLPATATVAPPPDLDDAANADLRTRTMTLTCVAGLAGAPAVVLPPIGDRLPAGACLVGRPGDDARLLAAARALHAARRSGH